MSKLYNDTIKSKVIFIQDNMERLEDHELDQMINIIMNNKQTRDGLELIDNEFYPPEEVKIS